MTSAPALAARSFFNFWETTDAYNFDPFVRIPLHADILGKAIVEKEDSDTGQEVDQAGFNSLHATVLPDFKHSCSVPEALLPLNKDHGV